MRGSDTRATRCGLVAAVGVALALLAGCASTSDDATRAALAGMQAPTANATAPTGTPTTVPTTVPCTDPTASLRPQGAIPAPGQMPAGTTMRTIQDRGRLIVGVDQNTLLFGYRNPRSGQLEGYDIDVARAVAEAIFGDPDRIEFRVVSTAERLPAVEQGKVDLVASLVTMTCPRWQEVSFSSQYYAAGQALMVRRDTENITGVADLPDKRVCATQGSTSAATLARLAPQAVLVPVTNRTECLVALQDGRVDAITADDTILYGFRAQDRTTKILHERLSDEPYGLAIAQEHSDLVRFVNAVLEQKRADGTLAGIVPEQLRTLRAADGITSDPPPARYQD